MSIPTIVFDYPIKRPYPWRLTTVLIFVTSTIILAVIIYVNVAIVGLTPTAYPSTIFERSSEPSWIDRVNIKKALNTRSCEPGTLVSGVTYRTQNGLFPYTIGNFFTNTDRRNYTLAYEGQAIESCGSVVLLATGGSVQEEFTLTAIMECTFSGGVSFSVSLSTEKNNGELKTQPYNEMARTIDDLVWRVGSDAEENFVHVFRSLNSTFQPCPFRVEVNSYERIPYWLRCNIDLPMPELDHGIYLEIIYLDILRSAIFSDLGIFNPRYSLLSNPELLRQTLQPNFDAMAQFNTTTVLDDFHARRVFSNMTRYGLPIEEPKPVQFLAQYICRSMTWKQPSNLFLDVLVATVSLFMAYWGILNCALQCLATRSSPHGNHCVCPNCNELPQHMASTSEAHALRSLDNGVSYESVPTNPEPTS